MGAGLAGVYQEVRRSNSLITWEEFWPRFIEKWARVYYKPKTVELLEYLSKAILSFFSDTPLIQTNDALIDDFKSLLKNKNLKPRTINLHVNAIRKSLMIAVRWKVLDQMPFTSIIPLKEGPLRSTSLDHDARGAVIEAAKASGHDQMIKFFLCTGLRRGELRELKWSDVLLQERGVQVRNSKTGTGRFIPLPDIGIEILRNRMRIRRLGVPYVFYNEKTGQPWKDLSHIVKKIFIKASLPHLRLHDLRHAYASHMHENGASQADLMALLGHTRPETTNRYIHVTHRRLEGLLSAVDRDIKDSQQLTLNSI